MPLERALSKLGVTTRTEARRLIESGRVALSGQVARDLWRLVVPERAAITIDGHAVSRAERLVILLHKPRGVVTTRRDPEGRPTVFDLLSEVPAHVIPVGRLDLASSGLLLFTNDTRLADWLTDPANQVTRRYIVTVRGLLTEDAAAQLVRGITIGREPMKARSVEVQKRSRRETHLSIELTEGRNREIRRLMEAVGHEVTRLLRVSFGGLELGTLQPGRWRVIADDELPHLRPP